jgi:hypothetical protein
MSTLHEIGREAHEINASNGWEVFAAHNWPTKEMWETDRLNCVRFIGTHIALIHSEVSEAMEGLRALDRQNFDEELADVIIRVASIAHGLGTDLETVIAKKLAKNRTRGLRHGGKAV